MLMKLFSLQMENGMMDKFCRQKHFSMVFDYELYQGNKIQRESNNIMNTQILTATLGNTLICSICLLCLRNKTISLFPGPPPPNTHTGAEKQYYSQEDYTNTHSSLPLAYRGEYRIRFQTSASILGKQSYFLLSSLLLSTDFLLN